MIVMCISSYQYAKKTLLFSGPPLVEAKTRRKVLQTINRSRTLDHPSKLYACLTARLIFAAFALLHCLKEVIVIVHISLIYYQFRKALQQYLSLV